MNRWEIQPSSAFNWRVVNVATGKIVVDSQPFTKCFEIKRNLEANCDKREASMGRR